MMVQLLIVEDEADIQELLQNYLETLGCTIYLADDGEQALEIFHQHALDLILLDVMLPKLDGYETCRLIRERSDVPIIMLTALDSEYHQLKGFDLQIDDYITKPFSMPILLRKVEAVLRRTCKMQTTQSIQYKNITLDLDGYRVYMDHQGIDLTRREFDLLKVLLENQGKVLTRQRLLNRIWGYDFYGDERIVDTHIKNIRKKLNTDIIETIRGVGYRIDKEMYE